MPGVQQIAQNRAFGQHPFASQSAMSDMPVIREIPIFMFQPYTWEIEQASK